MSRTIDTAEAARILGVLPGQVRKLCQSGKLKARRNGKQPNSPWVVSRKSVLEFAGQPEEEKEEQSPVIQYDETPVRPPCNGDQIGADHLLAALDRLDLEDAKNTARALVLEYRDVPDIIRVLIERYL